MSNKRNDSYGQYASVEIASVTNGGYNSVLHSRMPSRLGLVKTPDDFEETVEIESIKK